MMGGKRKTLRDGGGVKTHADGRLYRICRECGLAKRQEARNFSPTKREGARIVAWSGVCKPCASKRKAAWRAKVIAEGGEAAERLRASRRRVQLKWRKANPDKAKAIQKRRAQAVKADPERHARELERRRIEHRLRREREGKPSTRKLRTARMAPTAAPKTVPTAPIIAFIDRLVAERRAVISLIGEDRSKALSDGVLKAVCHDLGVTERVVYRWRHEQENATIGLVERVLLNAETPWHDVYSYDDHAAAFLAEPVQA